MATTRLTRALLLGRHATIVAGITGVLLAGTELAVRTLAPQTLQQTAHGGGSLGRADAVLGHVNRGDVRVSAVGPEFSVEYATNAQGLRDESAHPMPKPADLSRILVVGDSFAFGAGNDYEQIWPVIFERELAARGFHVDVVKAGVAAYDTTREALYLKRLVPDYAPDFVLLTFLPNDLFTNRPLTDNVSGAFAEDESVRSQNDEQFELHSVLLGSRWLMASDRLYTGMYRMTARADYFNQTADPPVARQLETTRGLLSWIQDFCARHGAAFVVFSIPQQVQVLAAANGQQASDFDVTLIDRQLSGFAHDEGFEWIPALPALADRYRSEWRDLYYRVDGHLNREGHRVAADLLSDEFEKRFARQLQRRVVSHDR
jgi:hypothetical protein